MRSNISPHFCENNPLKRFRFRSSRSQIFFKIDVLRNFTGKQLCWSLFLIKLQERKETGKRWKKTVFKCKRLVISSSVENSLESFQSFPGIFINIPRMFLNIPRNLLQHSPGSFSTFPGNFLNIPRNLLQH